MGSQSQEVYVAVGKDLLQSVSTLQWTLHNKPADCLVLLHVQHPIRTIPSPFGKIPVKRVCKCVVDAHVEHENRKLNDCMAFYLQICSQAKVEAKALIVKRADVRRGIVEMVSEQGIRKLIMGTSSAGGAKCRREIKRADKACYVIRHAISSCDISIVCKGKLLVVREGTVVDNEDFGGPLSLQPNIQLDSAVPIEAIGSFSDERGFTPDEGNQSGFDASLDLTGTTFELSSDIQLEQRTDRETQKFLLTELSEVAENARREVKRETVRRKDAKAVDMESPDKFRAIEAALQDAILVSKMKEEYGQELTRRVKEMEEELQAMVDTERSLSTQLRKFSHERHQAIQELHAAEEKITVAGMQNCRILKEKEEEIKELQDLLHSMETPSFPSTNVEFIEYSWEDITRVFWSIIIILIYCIIYHAISYNKYQVA
ncbi:hypothetical protein SUGI_0446280 [Cryptomeria japonica]|nr:hypothetical protein SUGI_0446280 [Cryptomeria japonica]